jgi:uncharacterized membrane protein YsdA (DUF1294 family)
MKVLDWKAFREGVYGIDVRKMQRTIGRIPERELQNSRNATIEVFS